MKKALMALLCAALVSALAGCVSLSSPSAPAHTKSIGVIAASSAPSPTQTDSVQTDSLQTDSAQVDPNGYTITDYVVQADISSGNVYSVTETITVDFTQPHHGIYRDIPLQGVTVTNVDVKGHKFAVSQQDGYVEIKIGDPAVTVEGEQTYEIYYKLGFGDDGSQDFDEVYFNIIGTQWNTAIHSASFSLTLPKPFDKDKLGFSMGAAGASGYALKDLAFSVEGNTIAGHTLRALSPYEGLTVRVELPQGYFNAVVPG
jgi:hypothetical protein